MASFRHKVLAAVDGVHHVGAEMLVFREKKIKSCVGE